MKMQEKNTRTPKTQSAPKDKILKGIAFACTAFFMFTVQNALNKLIADQHTAIEIAFYRNLICVVPCFLYVLIRKEFHLFKTKMPYTLTFRVLIGTVGLVLTLSAVQHLPISDATVFFFLSTLLIPVLAHFFLKEHIGAHRWIAVIIGMSGVILVAQPSGQVTWIGITIALGAAFVHAIIQVLIRAMKSENPFTITFYFFFVGALCLGIFLPWVGTMPTMQTVPYLLAIGLTGGLGQYFLTRGFQMAPASLLGPFNYTGLLWATGLDIFIWHYDPDWPVFVGGGIIILCGTYIIYRERVNAEK